MYHIFLCGQQSCHLIKTEFKHGFETQTSLSLTQKKRKKKTYHNLVLFQLMIIIIIIIIRIFAKEYSDKFQVCLFSDWNSKLDILLSWSISVYTNQTRPVSWGCRIHRLHLCRGVRHPRPLLLCESAMPSLNNYVSCHHQKQVSLTATKKKKKKTPKKVPLFLFWCLYALFTQNKNLLIPFGLSRFFMTAIYIFANSSHVSFWVDFSHGVYL